MKRIIKCNHWAGKPGEKPNVGPMSPIELALAGLGQNRAGAIMLKIGERQLQVDHSTHGRIKSDLASSANSWRQRLGIDLYLQTDADAPWQHEVADASKLSGPIKNAATKLQEYANHVQAYDYGSLDALGRKIEGLVRKVEAGQAKA